MRTKVVLVALLALGLAAFGVDTKDVLLFVRFGESTDIDYVVEQEAGVMISMIEAAGFKV